jgi:pimeloyl-ACP methyl ester carboxylesterase
MSERLHASLPNSVLHIVKDAGHMVHYFAPEQVAAAVESAAASTDLVAETVG